METVRQTDTCPAGIMRLITADCQAQVLASALHLSVFTGLSGKGATLAELRARLGLHERFAEDFLDVLAALGLLERDADGYRNTPLAQAYLDRDSPAYLGPFIESSIAGTGEAWAALTDHLRSGHYQRTDPDRGGFVGDRHDDHDRVRTFLSGLDAVSDVIGFELAARVDWSRYATFADLGGARGHLCAVLVRAHPHLRGVCVDLPRTWPLFTEHAESLGVADRVGFQGGDLLADPIPEADVLILGQVLHGFGEPDRVELVERAARALRPGGTLLVYDRMLDDVPTDAHRLLYSLHVRIASPAGSEYHRRDCARWLAAAGLTGVRDEPMPGGQVLVSGRRPSDGRHRP